MSVIYCLSSITWKFWSILIIILISLHLYLFDCVYTCLCFKRSLWRRFMAQFLCSFKCTSLCFSESPVVEVTSQHTPGLIYMTLVRNSYKKIPSLSTDNMNYSLSMVTQTHSCVLPLYKLKYNIPLCSPAELKPSSKHLNNTQHLMNHSPH